MEVPGTRSWVYEASRGTCSNLCWLYHFIGGYVCTFVYRIKCSTAHLLHLMDMTNSWNVGSLQKKTKVEPCESPRCISCLKDVGSAGLFCISKHWQTAVYRPTERQQEKFKPRLLNPLPTAVIIQLNFLPFHNRPFNLFKFDKSRHK